MELGSFCHNTDIPYIVSGDFNILRHNEEKNKKMHRSKSTDLFNSIINTLGLREIYMSEGKYSWANNQSHPTLEKLDRVLMSNSWEEMFPMVSVRKLARDLSDHNPFLLCTGDEKKEPTKAREFCFNLSWLKDDRFLAWWLRFGTEMSQAQTPLTYLTTNIKLKRFKTYFKGWSSNKFGQL